MCPPCRRGFKTRPYCSTISEGAHTWVRPYKTIRTPLTLPSPPKGREGNTL